MVNAFKTKLNIHSELFDFFKVGMQSFMKIDRMTIYTKGKNNFSQRSQKISHIIHIDLDYSESWIFSDIKPRSSAHILGIFDEVKALPSVVSVTYHWICPIAIEFSIALQKTGLKNWIFNKRSHLSTKFYNAWNHWWLFSQFSKCLETRYKACTAKLVNENL